MSLQCPVYISSASSVHQHSLGSPSEIKKKKREMYIKGIENKIKSVTVTALILTVCKVIAFTYFCRYLPFSTVFPAIVTVH